MVISTIGLIGGSVVAATQSYAAGSMTVGPVTFPAGFSTIMAFIDLQQCTSLTGVITFASEYSIDGGATWVSAGGGALDLSVSAWTLNASNQLVNADGGPVRLTGMVIKVPRTDLSRMVRCTLSINVPMTVGATIAGW